MVEIINVKERLGLLAYLVIFFVLSLTDAALWNDGTHFFYQLINHGLFVDHLWNRYSDLIYQLPTLVALKLFGWNHFSYWVFKATLYFFPLFSLAFVAMQRRPGEDQVGRFIWAVLFLVMPFGLMFPASIVNISVTFGTLALAVALRDKLSKWDLALFIFSHLILFFGHELGVFFILALILHYSMKIQDRKSRWYLGFELIFLILFVFTKYELFIKNTYYLSSLRLAGDSVGYFFLTVLLFSGFVKLVSKLSLANIAAGIVLFYFSVAMFANGQDEFYFSVSSVRFSLVPFVIMLFFIFRHRPLTMLSMGFIGHCSFILLAMSLKVFLTWTNFVLPNSTVVGCQVLPKQDLKWTPPGWTLPLYSVLKQYSLQPKSVWVLANSPEEKTCIRFGDYLVLDKDYQYHLMGFHWRIDGSLLLQNVPQAEFPIPYSDLKKQIILPRSGLIKFNGQNLIIPPGSCLNIDILHLSETDSNVIINIDGKEKYRETIRADITLSLPIDVNFNEVEIKVKTKFAYSMNVRSVTAASCL